MTRLNYPATQRNRDPILAVLREVLPPSGVVIEVASGSGQHVAAFAEALPHLTFQPTDLDDDGQIASIGAWTHGMANVLPPVRLDVTQTWPVAEAAAVMCVNMVHISPWACTLALLDGAESVLSSRGVLYLYGPYKRGGEHTSASNASFDASLRSRNPAWGVRDLDVVVAAAAERGLALDRVVEMPANNLSVVFYSV
jgi:hypothetical protein